MTDTAWHLAQINVARLLHPIDHPATAGFVDLLEPVNAVADAAPGFVWRLQDDSGDATAIDAYGDPMLIINLSVWEDIDSLRAFTYDGLHRQALQQRAEWFTGRDGPHLALWWVAAGHIPSIAEAVERLDILRARGPSPHAFTLVRPYPPPA